MKADKIVTYLNLKEYTYPNTKTNFDIYPGNKLEITYAVNTYIEIKF